MIPTEEMFERAESHRIYLSEHSGIDECQVMYHLDKETGAILETFRDRVSSKFYVRVVDMGKERSVEA